MECPRVLQLEWKNNEKQKAFSPHLAPWNGAKRLSGGFCWLGSVYRCEWLSVIECKLCLLCGAHPGKSKKKKRNTVPLSAHPHWHSGHSLFRFIGSLSNLWRELSICLAVPPAADMDSFGFAFQVSGSILGPLTGFLGKHFLPADLSVSPAPRLILPPS